MPSKVTIQNGQFQDATGTAIVGTLVLQLSQDAIVSGTGTVAPTIISIAVTAGNAAATPIWGNDNLSPSGTIYVATLFDTSGARVWGPENWSITGAGPIELNTLVPAAGGVSYPLAVDTTSTQTISGNKTFTGTTAITTLNASTLNAVLYVGGNITTWSGSDIGAQINSAYAALPATGGTIVVLPKTGGGSYLFSTPIVFTTASKPVLLKGTGLAGTSGTNNGVILEYTPTTATAAITLDYTTSGGSNVMAHGIRDLALWNNHTFSAGGTGSSATGILIGATNGGAGQAEFSNINVEGFGKGFDGSAATNVGWGMIYRSCRFVYNTTGLMPVSGETETAVSCHFLSNGTGVLGSTAEMYFYGCSFDGNTTVAVNWNGAASAQQVAFYGCHFENPGSTTANYVQGTANFGFYGGMMLNDTATSNVNWYVSASGYTLYVSGLEIQSNGQTATQVFLLNSPVRAYIAPINFSPTTLTTVVGGANAAFATILQSYANSANTNPLWQLESQLKSPLGIGDAAFTPSTSTGLHIRVHGNTLDALRMEDTDNSHVVDIGPAIANPALYSVRDVTNSKQIYQYSFSNQGIQFPASAAATTALAAQSPTFLMGVTSQKSETAADTSVLSVTPPAVAGTYRLHFTLSVSAATSATLGWTATWKDANGTAQSPTNLSFLQVGTAAPALTFTTSAAGNYHGEAIVSVDNSATAIIIKLTFTGTSFAGKASATIERLI